MSEDASYVRHHQDDELFWVSMLKLRGVVKAIIWYCFIAARGCEKLLWMVDIHDIARRD